MFFSKCGYFLVIISIFVWQSVFRRQPFNTSWAALCAKRVQYLIHFVPTQGPFFLFTPPIQQTCAPFWYIFFATLYQKTPQFLCYATYFWPKTPFYVVKHIKLFGGIKKKPYLCNRFQQNAARVMPRNVTKYSVLEVPIVGASFARVNVSTLYIYSNFFNTHN